MIADIYLILQLVIVLQLVITLQLVISLMLSRENYEIARDFESEKAKGRQDITWRLKMRQIKE